MLKRNAARKAEEEAMEIAERNQKEARRAELLLALRRRTNGETDPTPMTDDGKAVLFSEVEHIEDALLADEQERARGFRRLRRVRGHTAFARLLGEFEHDGEEMRLIGRVARLPGVPRDAYAFSSTSAVWRWDGQDVVAVEVKHMVYDVYSVPAGLVRATDAEAEAEFAAWKGAGR